MDKQTDRDQSSQLPGKEYNEESIHYLSCKNINNILLNLDIILGDNFMNINSEK